MIHFKNLNQAENYLANLFLNDAKDYFETINQEKKFQSFFELFTQLTNQRNADPNQLNLFQNEKENV